MQIALADLEVNQYLWGIGECVEGIECANTGDMIVAGREFKDTFPIHCLPSATRFLQLMKRIRDVAILAPSTQHSLQGPLGSFERLYADPSRVFTPVNVQNLRELVIASIDEIAKRLLSTAQGLTPEYFLDAKIQRLHVGLAHKISSLGCAHLRNPRVTVMEDLPIMERLVGELPCFFHEFCQLLGKNKALVLIALEHKRCDLGDVDERLWCDREVVLHAARIHTSALQRASPALR